MAEQQQQGFKRLNFFKIYMSEEDWNHRHSYHRDKQALHNRVFHGHGIVPYQGEELAVTQRRRATLGVDVHPGHFLTPEGHDALLDKPVQVNLPPDQYEGPCTVYFVGRLSLEEIKFVRFKSGRRVNRYFRELAEVEAITREPDPETEVELARVQLGKLATKLTDARDPDDPKENEIDLRHRVFARVLSPIDGNLREQLLVAIGKRREELLRLAGNNLLRMAAGGAFFLSCLELFVRNNLLPPLGILKLLEEMNFVDQEMIRLVEANIDDPWVAQRAEFTEFVRSVELVQGLVQAPPRQALKDLGQIISFQQRASVELGNMSKLYGDESLFFKEGQVLELPSEYVMGEDWEHVKVWSAEMPPTMIVDGLEWHLIDQLNITDEKSELEHKFRIGGAVDAWSSGQTLTFPDGTSVKETGVAHEGGYSMFDVRRVVPDTDLALIRMMDYARADYTVEIYCNEQFVGVSRCEGSDTKNRWRNWPFVIPARFVNSETVTIKQVMVTADRDINMFKYWFYQPLGW